MSGTYVDGMRLERTDYGTWLEGAKEKVDEFSKVRRSIPNPGVTPELQFVLEEQFRATAKLGNAIGALCHAIEERDELIGELVARVENLEEGET